MLGKLLKHEFRATGRVMLPLLGGLILLGLLTNISSRIISATDNALLKAMAGIIIFLFVMGCIAVCVMALVTIVARFRQSMLSDEGYLTHTLPVSVHQLIWSRVIVALVCLIATLVALGLSIFIAVYHVGMVGSVLNFLSTAIREAYAQIAMNSVAIIVELLLLFIVGGLTSCLIFYAAMSIGHSFANHKTLLSVVFFFVLQIGTQIVSTVAVMLVGYTSFYQYLFSVSTVPGIVTSIHAILWVFILGAAVLGAIYYVLTALMLKRRLNLQ